ncbi:MAG: hypothetical protein M1827_005258 [Pycnora praestabilis]|nr:MAG: hypothetical protein M1827_005258 [Pycnora praestabilis]
MPPSLYLVQIALLIWVCQWTMSLTIAQDPDATTYTLTFERLAARADSNPPRRSHGDVYCNENDLPAARYFRVSYPRSMFIDADDLCWENEIINQGCYCIKSPRNFGRFIIFCGGGRLSSRPQIIDFCEANCRCRDFEIDPVGGRWDSFTVHTDPGNKLPKAPRIDQGYMGADGVYYNAQWDVDGNVVWTRSCALEGILCKPGVFGCCAGFDCVEEPVQNPGVFLGANIASIQTCKVST